MYCGRSWLHEPPGSRASGLVPSRSTTIKLTSKQREDVIGFLVKRRCVRSRRLFCLAAETIHLQSPVISLVVANLLTTAKVRAHPRNCISGSSKRQEIIACRILRQTACKRRNSGSRPLRESLASQDCPNYCLRTLH